jgi:hypothetical protein
MSDEDLAGLLAAENLVKFKPDKRYIATTKIIDPSGNEMWAVNVAVGDEDDLFVEDSIPFKTYSRPGMPIHRRVPERTERAKKASTSAVAARKRKTKGKSQ